LDTTGVFASLLLLTVLGVVLYYAVEAVQRLFVPGALSQSADPAQATM
jgi:ABC-type nitrate/sulfonate/bicarbonate transport system permease component